MLNFKNLKKMFNEKNASIQDRQTSPKNIQVNRPLKEVRIHSASRERSIDISLLFFDLENLSVRQ